jgi:hypothetical protein
MLALAASVPALAEAAQLQECFINLACDRSRCISVPGLYSQTFSWPDGGVGRTAFSRGNAYFLSDPAELKAAISDGRISLDTRFVVYPDDQRKRGAVWMDAIPMVVWGIDWSSGKPTLSKTSSVMVCPVGNP